MPEPSVKTPVDISDAVLIAETCFSWSWDLLRHPVSLPFRDPAPLLPAARFHFLCWDSLCRCEPARRGPVILGCKLSLLVFLMLSLGWILLFLLVRIALLFLVWQKAAIFS